MIKKNSFRENPPVEFLAESDNDNFFGRYAAYEPSLEVWLRDPPSQFAANAKSRRVCPTSWLAFMTVDEVRSPQPSSRPERCSSEFNGRNT